MYDKKFQSWSMIGRHFNGLESCPLTWVTMAKSNSVYDKLFVVCLALSPVSIGLFFGLSTYLLWLRLDRKDSAFWMFALPVFGGACLLYMYLYIGVKIWRGERHDQDQQRV